MAERPGEHATRVSNPISKIVRQLIPDLVGTYRIFRFTVAT